MIQQDYPFPYPPRHPNAAEDSYDVPGLKAGDVIECRQITAFVGDLYLPMIVRRVEPHKFSAELLKGDFGSPGETMMSFEMTGRGRTWR